MEKQEKMRSIKYRKARQHSLIANNHNGTSKIIRQHTEYSSYSHATYIGRCDIFFCRYNLLYNGIEQDGDFLLNDSSFFKLVVI